MGIKDCGIQRTLNFHSEAMEAFNGQHSTRNKAELDTTKEEGGAGIWSDQRCIAMQCHMHKATGSRSAVVGAANGVAKPA